MSTFTETVVETFHIVRCYACGVRFGIGVGLYRRAVLDKKGWVYCPACGEQSCWTGKTEAEKLRDELIRERARLDQTRAQLEHVENRRRAAIGQVTKIRNRISKGVCPCCNRHFDNLAAHMKSQHPTYTKDEN